MKTLIKLVLSFTILFSVSSCQQNEPISIKNDMISKSTGPILVGSRIEFAYAMASIDGVLSEAKVVASIAGDDGTNFEPYTWHTNSGGVDVSVEVAKDCLTTGNTSSATINDTCKSTTLRYFYVVPEIARGKKVSFIFSTKSSTGKTTEFKSPEYIVSSMDMTRLISLSDNDACYISISKMRVYNSLEVSTQDLSSLIDLVYIYRANVNTYTYGHSLVSPASPTQYLAGAIIPDIWQKNSTKIEKRVDVKDAQLKGNIPNAYIDDIDFQQTKLDQALDYSLNFKLDYGAFVMTQDGKYIAYVYFNAVNDAGKTATISIKRYTLK